MSAPRDGEVPRPSTTDARSCVQVAFGAAQGASRLRPTWKPACSADMSAQESLYTFPNAQVDRGLEPRHVAVYGTLRLERVRRGLGVAAMVDPRGRCLLPGRLHDLGAYPGLMLDRDGEVVAELLAVVDDAALGVLDGYEGYRPDDPDGSLFRRVALQCLDAPLVAWCYLYNRAPAGAPVIGSGDWLAAR